MKEIPLTKGLVAIVDDEDFAYLNQFVWFVNNGYAARTSPRDQEGKQYQTKMHREIMKPAEGVHVDHINGNRLDNRRCNLRLCTNEQNRRNQKKQQNVKFKGVYRRKEDGKWEARIALNKQRIHLGRFETAEEAAAAYDRAAVLYHGQFARLNFGDTK